MKRIKYLSNIIILILIFSSGSSFAFNVGGARHDCRPPKFRSFSPPERVNKEPVPEVESGSEISFTVSATADPDSIVVMVRKQIIEKTIIDKKTFFQVKAKLPVAFNGKFARIDLRAKDRDGGCKTEDGWLIKIKKAAEKVVEEVPESEPVVVEDE